MVKAILLVGGPKKGTRFRPLSLDCPKPLFPIAGFPIIYHHIEACCKVVGMKEILIIGFYQLNESFKQFIYDAQMEFKIQIRYLQEFASLGTAGGIYHFRDQILSGSPDFFFVLNSDVCCDHQLDEMLQYHKNLLKSNDADDIVTMMITEATSSQSLSYGCAVVDKLTNEILHYVEKPSTFVSTFINCGIYLFTAPIFSHIKKAFNRHQEKHFRTEQQQLVIGNSYTKIFDSRVPCNESINLETEVFQPLAGSGRLFAFNTNRFWSQIKSAGSVIYANRHQLEIYRSTHPEWLANNNYNADGDGPRILGNVYIHKSATIDPSALIGPNVSIGKYVVVEAGVRLRDCVILPGVIIRAHACILNAVIAWDCVVGQWARVEGTAHDPNPNKPFAKLNTLAVFNEKGQLNPSITIIGSNVEIPPEVIIFNSIVLPHKELCYSAKNQIIL